MSLLTSFLKDSSRSKRRQSNLSANPSKAVFVNTEPLSNKPDSKLTTSKFKFIRNNSQNKIASTKISVDSHESNTLIGKIKKTKSLVMKENNEEENGQTDEVVVKDTHLLKKEVLLKVNKILWYVC